MPNSAKLRTPSPEKIQSVKNKSRPQFTDTEKNLAIDLEQSIIQRLKLNFKSIFRHFGSPFKRISFIQSSHVGNS